MKILKLNKEGSSFNEVYLLTGSGSDPSRSNFFSMTFDENHCYLYNQSVGLFKIGIENSVTIKEGVFYAKNLINDGLQRSIVYLNNKIYCWTHENVDYPLTVYDKSLKCATDDEFKKLYNRQKRNLEIHYLNRQTLDLTDDSQIIQAYNKGTSQSYRQLFKSPLFSDGKHLYLISTNFIKSDQDSDVSSLINVERFYSVEKYDPVTLKFVESIKLDFEFDTSFEKINEAAKTSIIDDTEKAKQMLGEGSLGLANCFTNGKLLAIGKRGTLYLFLLETGKRLYETLKVPFSYGGYNYINSKFWGFNSLDSSSLTLSSFIVKGFLSQSKEDNHLYQISTLSNQRVSNITKLMKSGSKSIIKKDVMLLISSVVHSNNVYEHNQNATIESLSGDTCSSLFLILNLLYKGCQKADLLLSEFDSLDQNKVEERFKIRTQMFRSEFCVTISNKFFNQLTVALHSCNSIVEGRLTNDNINEQYQLYFLISLVMTALKSAERLGITLSSILQNQTEYKEFIESLEYLLSRVTDISESLSRFENDEGEEELKALWSQCGLICRDIKFILLNTCSQSDDTLVSKLDEIIDNFEQSHFKLPNSVFLDYLTMTSTLDMICKDANSKILLKLLRMFELLCKHKTSKMIAHLKTLEYGKACKHFNYNEFEGNAEKIIYAIAKKVLIVIYSPYKSIVDEMDKEIKKRKEELENKVMQSMNHFNTVINIISKCITQVFNQAYEIVNVFNKTEKHYVSGKATDEKIISKNTEIKHKCEEFYDQLHNIIYENNRFLDIVHIYTACVVSNKEHSINEYTLNLCFKVLTVLKSLTILADCKSSIVDISDCDSPQLDNSIKELSSFLTWSLSKIAHDYILCTTNYQKNSLHKIMMSKLMSGGIERRYETLFSENSQKEMTLINGYLDDIAPSISEHNENDKTLESIMQPGNNNHIDTLLNLLNWNIQKKYPDEVPKTEDEIGVVRAI